MSQINLNQVSFSYIAGEPVFDNVSLMIDSSWKLGLIGRNGRGKTTLLKLFTGELPYTGSIETTLEFEYFPTPVSNPYGTAIEVARELIAPYREMESDMQQYLTDGSEDALLRYADVLETYQDSEGYRIDELIEKETTKLNLSSDRLQMPLLSLSSGEKLKLGIAALFLRKNCFLLLDEPFSHLDEETRLIMAEYLSRKKGFILVSHERDLLDRCVDHILSINRGGITLTHGNYSVWATEAEQAELFEQRTNEKLKKEISRLQSAARTNMDWAKRVEATKYGNGPVDRGYIGHKSAKMMQRAKAVERRQERAIEEKMSLLRNAEHSGRIELKTTDCPHEQLMELRECSVVYNGRSICEPVTFEILRGERIAIKGLNGSGKSGILRLLAGEAICHTGTLYRKPQLLVSYLTQDCILPEVSISEYARNEQLDEPLLRSLLVKLGFEVHLFGHTLAELSDGQKKKIALAGSLSRRAHLYLWDEPLNGIDILSRIQIENLILQARPTMLFVEHDAVFTQRIATKIVNLNQIRL